MAVTGIYYTVISEGAPWFKITRYSPISPIWNPVTLFPSTAGGDIVVDQAAGFLYFVTGTPTNSLYRCKLDGSELTLLVPEALTNPTGLAIDLIGGRLYIGGYNCTFRRCNLNGTGVELLGYQGGALQSIVLHQGEQNIYFTNNSGTRGLHRLPMAGGAITTILGGGIARGGMAIDEVAGKIYYFEWGSPWSLRRCNLNGTGVEILFSTPLTQAIHHIELDILEGKLYYSMGALVSYFIRRCNLDGTGDEAISTLEQGIIHFALSEVPPSPPPKKWPTPRQGLCVPRL